VRGGEQINVKRRTQWLDEESRAAQRGEHNNMRRRPEQREEESLTM